MLEENKLKTKKTITKEQKEEALKNGIDLSKYAKRTPIRAEKRLGIKDKPGWTRALINKSPGRVEECLEAGWSIVDDASQLDTDGRLQDGKPLGKEASLRVNKRNDALWTDAVYMEIPTVIFEHDKKLEEEQNDKTAQRYGEGTTTVGGDPNIKQTIKFNTK